MNDKKPNRIDVGALSWVLIVIAFNIFFPAGLFFLITRLRGNDIIGNFIASLIGNPQTPKNSGATSGYTGRSSSSTRGSWQTSSTWPPRTEERTKPTEAPNAGEKPKRQRTEPDKSNVSRVSKGRVPLQVFGWILLGIGAAKLLDAGIYSFGSLMQTLGVLLSGAGLLVAAFGKKRRENEYRKCVNTVAGRSYIRLSVLSKSTGIQPNHLEKDIEDMLERGYFGNAAYYDKAGKTLIIHPELAQQQLRKEAEARAAEQRTAGEREAAMHKDQYALLLDELGRSVSKIRDSRMSDKAKLIYSLAASIFSAVREDEEKRPKLAGFLNYYFPTTIKLLNTYSEFESQGYQGETLSKSRERIEGAADRIITAYRKQLDALYLSDTIDVDSDISVLETMLKRDGLTDSDFNIGTPSS